MKKSTLFAAISSLFVTETLGNYNIHIDNYVWWLISIPSIMLLIFVYFVCKD